MAKAPPIEQQLLELSSLRATAKSAEAREKFTKALSGKNNLLAARAATIITETEQADFLPLLATAFDRFFVSGTDKGCSAKTGIANGLYTLGFSEIEPFLRGIHHTQPEAVWGGQADAAAELRGLSALGLVRAGYRDVMLELAGLLMDPEPVARQMAVRAVIYADQEPGPLLLRMKILAGDKNADVIAEALAGLMKLAPGKSLDFVARFLEDFDAATAESAALAIGGARTPAAFELLQKRWEQEIQPEPRAPLLLGIAMTRQPAAIEFLLQRIEEDSPRPAANAVSAMAMYKHDEALRMRITTIITARNEPILNQAFAKAFDIP